MLSLQFLNNTVASGEQKTLGWITRTAMTEQVNHVSVAIEYSTRLTKAFKTDMKLHNQPRKKSL